MSLRAKKPQPPSLKEQISSMRDHVTASDVSGISTVSTSNKSVGDGSVQLTMADLSETERSAASLGVDPEAWRPIAFMNEGHYTALRNANMIDNELTRKLEAYRAVASGTES